MSYNLYWCSQSNITISINSHKIRTWYIIYLSFFKENPSDCITLKGNTVNDKWVIKGIFKYPGDFENFGDGF